MDSHRLAEVATVNTSGIVRADFGDSKMIGTNEVNAIRSPYKDAVSRPGKFEGEHPIVPYLWDQLMDGATPHDSDGLGYPEESIVFALTDWEALVFGRSARYICIIEDDQGFVREIEAR
jgi:hypothetical protein